MSHEFWFFSNSSDKACNSKLCSNLAEFLSHFKVYLLIHLSLFKAWLKLRNFSSYTALMPAFPSEQLISPPPFSSLLPLDDSCLSRSHCGRISSGNFSLPAPRQGIISAKQMGPCLFWKKWLLLAGRPHRSRKDENTLTQENYLTIIFLLKFC